MTGTQSGTLLREVILATASLLRSNDLDTSVQNALARVGQAVGADAAALFEYPASHASDGGGDAIAPCSDPEPEGEPILLFAWSDAQPDWDAKNKAVRSGAQSTFTMTLPVTVGGKSWGTLRFDTSDERTEWTRERIGILRLMAQNFGEAICRARDVEVQATDDTLPDVVAQVMDHAQSSGQLQGGVAVVRPDGTVLFQNESLVDVSGWTRVGLNRNGGLLPNLRPVEARRRVKDALTNGSELETEVSVGAVDSVSVQLQLTPVVGRSGAPVCTVCWFQSTAPNIRALSNERQNLSLRRRVRAERALVEASQLLVSSDACDFDRLLEIVGEATGARYAYLVIITPDDVVGFPKEQSYAELTRQPIHLDTYRQHEWFASSRATVQDPEEDGGPTFAVPILSSDDQLFGYMGVEYKVGSAPYRDEDARVLSVLGDMLCTYLRRQLSEEALRRSEQRYRYFVDTIAEAIWRVDLQQPVPVDEPVEQQVEHVLEHGVISEANEALARLFKVESSADLIGRAVSEVLDVVSREFLYDLASAGFELRQHEYVVVKDEGRKRHFMMNTIGVKEDGRIQGIWGSGTEVTERVVLERRMVEALERQQQRFGHNLHDRVSQQLAGTRMLAQNLSARYFEEDEQGQREVDKIIEYVQEAAQHVSDLQRGVMPVQVDRDGLAQGLQELASRIERSPDIDCVFRHDGETDIGHHEVKLQLYRIAQEATRNAMMHGNPTQVKIELHGDPDAIVLRVTDNGDGFELSQADDQTASTLGIHSMRYRAHTIGAMITIDSEAGEGTTVEVHLPRELLRRKLAE